MIPRVSVVVATRDRRPQLARALASVDAQTFRDLETVVVDDGSADSTAAWLREHRPAVRTVALETPGGAAAARNRGIAAARGELIAFLDDDDAWGADYLAAQVAQLDARPEATASYAEHVEVDASGRRARPDLGPLLAYRSPLVRLLAECFVHTLSVVVCRRAAFERFGLFDERLAVVHDLDWFGRLLTGGGELLFLPGARVERGVPGGLVSAYRLWEREERTVHARLFAAGRVAPSDQRLVRVSRGLLFARIGWARGDLGFGLARLAAAFVRSPIAAARVAALRIARRRGRARRDAAEAWSVAARSAP